MTNTELIARHIKPEKGKEIGICKVCGQKNGIIQVVVIPPAYRKETMLCYAP